MRCKYLIALISISAANVSWRTALAQGEAAGAHLREPVVAEDTRRLEPHAGATGDVGACCDGSACVDTEGGNCTGFFLGAGSSCATNPCASGVCCVSEPACLERTETLQPMTEFRCAVRGGVYLAGRDCDSGRRVGAFEFRGDPCQPYRVPPGYEIVEVTWEYEWLYRWIRINDCGQMVFFRQSRESLPSEVYFYDNGTLVEIGDGPKNNQFPDLNDLGDISWSRDQTIVLLKRSGELIEIGGGTSHSLNNLGHLAFKGGSQFFDGNTVISIEQPGDGSMQSVDLNDLDEMVWTHYHSGGSDINLYQNGVVTVLPSLSENPQGADLNNNTRVVWNALGGIEFWNGNQTVTIDDGRTASPALNDHDDIAYLVRPPPGGGHQVRLRHHDGTDYTISNPLDALADTTAGGADINNDGEIAWTWRTDLPFEPSGVTFMRRIRNGGRQLRRPRYPWRFLGIDQVLQRRDGQRPV